MDDFVAEHMKTFGLRLLMTERLTLCEQARAQSELSTERYVLFQLQQIQLQRIRYRSPRPTPFGAGGL